MRIRLTRKLANLLNGIDLSRRRVGEVIDLPVRDAQLLLAEGWARLVPDHTSATTPARPTRSGRRPRKLTD